jgi:hypothetical protein
MSDQNTTTTGPQVRPELDRDTARHVRSACLVLASGMDVAAPDANRAQFEDAGKAISAALAEQDQPSLSLDRDTSQRLVQIANAIDIAISHPEFQADAQYLRELAKDDLGDGGQGERALVHLSRAEISELHDFLMAQEIPKLMEGTVTALGEALGYVPDQPTVTGGSTMGREEVREKGDFQALALAERRDREAAEELADGRRDALVKEHDRVIELEQRCGELRAEPERRDSALDTLDRDEIKSLYAHAAFCASDAAGETNPPNPGKAARWAATAAKLKAALDAMSPWFFPPPSRNVGERLERIADIIGAVHKSGADPELHEDDARFLRDLAKNLGDGQPLASWETDPVLRDCQIRAREIAKHGPAPLPSKKDQADAQ